MGRQDPAIWTVSWTTRLEYSFDCATLLTGKIDIISWITIPFLVGATVVVPWPSWRGSYQSMETKLLVFNPASSIIKLLSTNNTYLRDNTVYIVTLFLFHCWISLFIVERSLFIMILPSGVSFLLSPTWQATPYHWVRHPYFAKHCYGSSCD